MSGYTDAGVSGDLGVLPGTTWNGNPDLPGAAGSSGIFAGTGTGQYGVTTGDSVDDTGNPFVDTWQWINAPFKSPLDPLDIFLIVGIVIFASLAWTFVLYHIRIAGEAI